MKCSVSRISSDHTLGKQEQQILTTNVYIIFVYNSRFWVQMVAANPVCFPFIYVLYEDSIEKLLF